MKNTQSSTSQANVISALYQSRIKRNSVLDQMLVQFITSYQTVQKSLWSGNDDAFARAFQEFLIACTNVSTSDWFPSAFFLLIPLLEAATEDGLFHLDLDINQLQSLSQRAPEALQSIWEEVLSEFRQRVQQSGSRTIERTPRDFTNNDFAYPWPDVPRPLGSLWYETDSTIVSIADFISKYRLTKLLFGTDFGKAAIYGSVYYEDRSNVIIHLISFTKNYNMLKTYVEGLIGNLRKEDGTNYANTKKDPPKWREEYVKEIFKDQPRPPFIIGESWDEFPYPHPTRTLPGITTWLAKDGRAEIIVRKREK